MATATAARSLPSRALARTPPAGIVRLSAFAALCLFASLQWVRQVAPADATAAVVWTLVATAAGALLVGSRALPARSRIAAVVAVGVISVIAVMLACGVPLWMLRPREWGAVTGGIGQGLESLPDLRIPYRGVDEWVRTVVLAGGGLLAVTGAALACWPGEDGRGSPLAAGIVLATLYGVPIVERGPQQPFLNGAVFALLLAAFLWGDRLAQPQLPLAGALTVAAIVFGLALAPRLDASEPWIDYRNLAGDLARTGSVRFDWNHRYTPLDWPRRGEEVLRVKAPAGAYWKGLALERFDGTHWRSDPRRAATAEEDTEMTIAHPEWRQEVRVVARDIRSRELYAPGDVIKVEDLGRPTVPGPGGTRAIPEGERALRPGDGYRAEVYSPKPSPFELRTAGTEYPAWLRSQTAVELPLHVGGPQLPITGTIPGRNTPIAEIPFFGHTGRITLASETQPGSYPGRQALLDSEYERAFRLARELRAGATTPYQIVQRILRRVRGGATYSENPPPSRVPLMDFLFGSKTGYCQQFSGAMALLLRFAGIPARVAAGFAPGVFDRGRAEHVVRDYDAHSWVEVYFPQLGWVAFDPTPSSAPPASQASDNAASAATGDSRDLGGDRPAERSRPIAEEDGSRLGAWLALGAAVLLALATLLFVRRRRRATTDTGPPELLELRRALARTGRAPTLSTTLQSIEAGFAGDREAQGYVRTLRLARYGRGGVAPTVAQRAALRRALAAGLGLRGRLAAWRALPPRAAELRQALRLRPYTR